MNLSDTALLALGLDIGVFFIIIMAVFRGARRGFAAVLIRLLAQILCLIIAALSAQPLSDYLIAKTGLYDRILSRISRAGGTAPLPLSRGLALPGFASYFDTARHMTLFFIRALCFLLIFFVLVLITRALFHFFAEGSRRRTGFFNGLLGAGFGALRGILIVSILMLILSLFLTFGKGSRAQAVLQGIQATYLASFFYEHNPLLFLFHLMTS